MNHGETVKNGTILLILKLNTVETVTAVINVSFKFVKMLTQFQSVVDSNHSNVTEV